MIIILIYLMEVYHLKKKDVKLIAHNIVSEQ